MEKKVVFSKIEIMDDMVSLRLVLDHGNGFGDFHRVTFANGIPPEVMVDAANQEFKYRGFPPIPEEVVDKVFRVIKAAGM